MKPDLDVALGLNPFAAYAWRRVVNPSITWDEAVVGGIVVRWFGGGKDSLQRPSHDHGSLLIAFRASDLPINPSRTTTLRLELPKQARHPCRLFLQEGGELYRAILRGQYPDVIAAAHHLIQKWGAQDAVNTESMRQDLIAAGAKRGQRYL